MWLANFVFSKALLDIANVGEALGEVFIGRRDHDSGGSILASRETCGTTLARPNAKHPSSKTYHIAKGGLAVSFVKRYRLHHGLMSTKNIAMVGIEVWSLITSSSERVSALLGYCRVKNAAVQEYMRLCAKD